MIESKNTRRNARSKFTALTCSILAIAAINLLGCASEVESEEDSLAESSDALSQDDICLGRNVSSERCNLTKFYLHVGAPDDRKVILERAFSWVDAQVKYNANASYGGFMRDCSGLVSMAWGLDRTYATAKMAPFDASFTWELPSVDELIPGDAISRRQRRNGKGHIMLFAGWADEWHTSFFTIEQRSTGIPTALSQRPRSFLDGYAPIRHVWM